LRFGFILVIALGGSGSARSQALRDLGVALDDKALAAWDIDVAPNGSGLPPGRGDVATGQQIFARRCSACHGAGGEGKPADRLVGGQGTLATEHPIKTIGSYWPYATTLFDYVRRAMPYSNPQSLTPDEVYSVTAWLLFANGVVEASASLDARTLPQVRMPNRNGFVADPRPDVH
jgi:cytochrome c